MKDEQRIKQLEDEIKILKNEVQAVLLDLREQYLNLQNPFNSGAVANPGSEDAPSQPGVQPQLQAQAQPQQQLQPQQGSVFPSPVQPDCPQNWADARQQDQGNYQQGYLQPQPWQQDQYYQNYRPNNPELDLSKGPALFEKPANTPARVRATQDTEMTENLLAALKKTAARQDAADEKSAVKVDLVVIAGLTQWVDQAVSRLGKQKTIAVIDICCTMGRLPVDLRDTLAKVARLSTSKSKPQQVAASDYLAVLTQLESFLPDSQCKDRALLSILSMMKEPKDG